jgi:AI-2 transport protein TqsA
MNSKLSNIFLGIIAFIWIGFLLYIGKSIFISLILATFIYILLTSAYDFFYSKVKNCYISVWACIFSMLIFIGIVSTIISTQVDAFWEELPKYKEVFAELTSFLQIRFWINFDITSLASKINFPEIFSWFSTIATGFLWQVWTILFLLIFMFLEKKHFKTKFEKILSRKEEKHFLKIVEKIDDDLSLYFWVKFLLALTNGFVSFIIMFMFWLEYALFFALLVFLLDFIPNIWGIIALSLPFLFSFTLFDSTFISFLLLWALLIPQTITGNIIEPKLMGKRLNISWFVILISLLFWGSLWWVIWAFLAVPLMTSIKIILARFKKTETIAILLSEKGNI